jgi:beta-glucosidase
VTNRGDRPGSEVVQVYVRALASRVHRPDKELRGFAKVHLEPGASRTVTIDLGPRAFASYDVASADWQVEAGTFEIVVGTSSVDVRATATVEVESAFVREPSAAPAGFVADDTEFAAMLGRPVPRPDPLLPFHRNSAVADLEATRLGRMLKRTIVEAGRRQTGAVGAGDDEVSRLMFEAVVAEAPLRGLVVLGGGRVSFRTLDAMIDVLNGHPIRALRRLLPGRRRDPR